MKNVVVDANVLEGTWTKTRSQDRILSNLEWKRQSTSERVYFPSTSLVSGLIGKGASGQILLKISSRKIVPHFSRQAFRGYVTVLHREKFKRYRRFYTGASELLNDIKEFGEIIEPKISFRARSAPRDDTLLDSAVAAEAEFLITGNATHFPSHSFHGVRIVSPAEFLRPIA